MEGDKLSYLIRCGERRGHSLDQLRIKRLI
jgi:hypothetical protein